MSDDKKKPSGDMVTPDQRAIDRAAHSASQKGTTPAQECQYDHSGIRGRRCGGCGTYFRGDDMG